MNNKGFTLVEVIAVVAIIALLGTLTAPSILNSLETGRDSSDRILYGDIKEAMQVMYEDIYYMDSKICEYDNNGKNIKVENGVEKCGKYVEIVETNIEEYHIKTTIQTLISNGYLTGVNNEDLTINKNRRIVVDSGNIDLWMCPVVITRKKQGNKIYYEVSGLDDENNENYCICPTTNEFRGGEICKNTN